MNAKTLVVLIVVLVIMFAMYFPLINWVDSKTHNKEQKLKENVEKTVNYDSIISITERKLLDSIKGIREELQKHKDDQHRQNIILRKKNADLEGKINSIDTGGRPDF